MNKIAEIDLVYRSKVKASQRIKVSNSNEAHAVFRKHWDNTKIEMIEEFKILLLSRSNQCLGISNISSGGVAGPVVDAKIIFSYALKVHASGFIMCHNHPSGDLNASRQDIELTQRIKQAGILMEIKLIDHLIISAEGYYSMVDEGDL